MNGISSLIAGKKNTQTEGVFPSINPSHRDDTLGFFASASLEECKQACLVAKNGFRAWSSTPAPVRAQTIANFARLIEKNKDALAKLITREMGKPIKEAHGDVQEAIDTCFFFISEGRRLYGQTVPSEMANKELFTYRRPIGVFACLTAGNFPFAVPSWYFVPALVCGNSCVWKPSEETPCTSLVFAELLHAAGVPEDVFQVVFGTGPQTGEKLLSLVDEGLIDKVGFTGSTAVGRKIGEICGRNLQTPCLELGGKNPLVVMPDADLDLVTQGVIWSAYATAGQRCTSLGNLIVHSSVEQTLLEKVLRAIDSMVLGDPSCDQVFYGPLISQRFLEQHIKHLETLILPHHRILTPYNGRIGNHNRPASFVGEPEEGFYAFPTVVAGVTQDDPIFSLETFGPLFNVVNFNDIEEAISLSNASGYGLSSAIYTKNMDFAYRFRTGVQAGLTSINNSTTGAEAHLPFGGNGKSGNGSRQSGIWVVDQFTKWQAVNWDMSGILQLAQIDTHSISPVDYVVRG